MASVLFVGILATVVIFGMFVFVPGFAGRDEIRTMSLSAPPALDVSTR